MDAAVAEELDAFVERR
ncbi:MAG: hypothetical protein AAF642_19775, partial [Pseudomonadota bacterium]